MRQALAIGVAASLLLLSASAEPTKTKSTAKKTPASARSTTVSTRSTTASKSSAHTGVAAHPSTARATTHSRSRARRTRVAATPSYQQHPDPERYQEIQKALADRGYFKGEVNGQWGDDSVDAMKRFQADQKLSPDGKINSLTLIGLGLGPKHDLASSSVSPAGQAATPLSTPVPQNTPDATKPPTSPPGAPNTSPAPPK